MTDHCYWMLAFLGPIIPVILILFAFHLPYHSFLANCLCLSLFPSHKFRSTRLIFRILKKNLSLILKKCFAVNCFNNWYVGKQPVAWKEYFAEYWLKELQDRNTGFHNITEIRSKMALSLSQTSPGFYVSAVQVF